MRAQSRLSPARQPARRHHKREAASNALRLSNALAGWALLSQPLCCTAGVPRHASSNLRTALALKEWNLRWCRSLEVLFPFRRGDAVSGCVQRAVARAVRGCRWGRTGETRAAIRLDPRDHAHLYLGTANGWIYESHNIGETWVRLAQDRQAGRPGARLDCGGLREFETPHRRCAGSWIAGRWDLLCVMTRGTPGSTAGGDAGPGGTRAGRSRPSDPKLLVAGSLQGVFRVERRRSALESGSARRTARRSTRSSRWRSIRQDPKVIYAGTWHLPWRDDRRRRDTGTT